MHELRFLTWYEFFIRHMTLSFVVMDAGRSRVKPFTRSVASALGERSHAIVSLPGPSKPMTLRLLLIICSVSAASFVSPVLRAQQAENPATQANALFESGLKSKETGDEATACARFEASVALSPTPHGWLQVGTCRERRDLLGALEGFEEALGEAQRLPDGLRRTAYETAARERIAQLSPRVPTITFRRSPTPNVSVDITREGRELSSAVDRFDEPIRFAPGQYRVRTWAASYHSSLVEVDLGEAQRHVVVLPALQPLPVASPPPDLSASTESVAPPAARREREFRIDPLPVALVGAGLALVVGGVISGQISSAQRDELRRGCAGLDPDSGQRLCGAELGGTKKRMENFALAADVAWIGGALLAGAGLAVFLLNGDSEQPARVAVGCFMDGCGLSAAGRF